jgi:ribosomal protein L11
VREQSREKKSVGQVAGSYGVNIADVMKEFHESSAGHRGLHGDKAQPRGIATITVTPRRRRGTG